MNTETKSLAQRLKEHLESPEGQKSMEDYFNKLAQRDAIERARAKNIIEKWGVCDDATFDDLMLTILEKQSKYDERHYSTYTDRPLRIMNLMWEIASSEGVEIDPIDGLTESFSSMVYDYYGYQFAITHGQGSVLSVYRQNELRYRS
jgi:hypothetical protein